MPELRGGARPANISRLLIFGMAFVACVMASAQTTKQPPGPISISVDATGAAQKVLHAELSIPTKPGILTLYYPKWMPADHSPDGPTWTCARLQFSPPAHSTPVTTNAVDCYSFRL